MGHLTLELILWLLLAFFIGCILGCLFRKLFGGSESETATVGAAAAGSAAVATAATAPKAPKAEAKPAPVAAPKPEPVATPEPKPAPEPMPAVATGVAKRPKGLAAARDGKADELQRISGIGPKLDKTLHSLGYFHFDQIAGWTPDEVQWVDEHLRFKGRIDREEWIPQAKLLANGQEAEFTRLYGTGGMKSSKTGSALSGERTKRASTEKSSRPAAKKADKPKAKAAVATGIAKAPRKLKAAKGGKADDLQRISGVGPKLEKTLHGLGFFHFDQIAGWTPDEVQWVDENLRFKGRIDREEWIPQAKLLAAGDEKKFASRYGSGGLKDKSGKTKSGSRTRKT